MIQQLGPAMSVVGQALDALAESDFDAYEKKSIVQSNVSCKGMGEVRWSQGETLFKFLKNVSVPQKSGLTLEFNNDGSLKSVELLIVNLQEDLEASKNAQTEIKRWEEIGTWQASPEGTESTQGLGTLMAYFQCSSIQILPSRTLSGHYVH